MENIFKDNSTNLHQLISYIKTPEQIIKSFKDRLIYMNTGLKRIINNNIEMAFKDLSVLNSNLKIPYDLIKFNKSNIKSLTSNLHSVIKREWTSNTEKYKHYIRLVQTNSIQSNLKKGYSIISKDKKIINKTKHIRENDILSARLMDKTIEIKVKKIN